MDNLIWLIVFGALFYFMMRKGGCGGGHSHGGHKSGHKSGHRPQHMSPADYERDKGEKKHSGCH